MAYLLQVDFPYAGPWGAEMAAGMTELAHSIAAEPGLIWKLWTENPAAGEAGGIYLFQEQAQAEAYLAMHTARLKQFGLSRINGKIFAVNETLSRLTRWPGSVHAG
ncbi:monooxygenase [Serratia ureilytica]|uniref:monooxygenase n=1 Tax=Serratia ureilytica TaxID=300181 RepID=UPI000B8ED126|nr:monooxygenase [Serratia ureilytica]MEB5996079.1 monooxygenase [Serratia ureilytica]